MITPERLNTEYMGLIKILRKTAAWMTLAAMLVSLGGCEASEGGSTGTSDGRLSIVTTIFPPYDFVRQIAGDKAEVRMLLKPGQESHTYEPTAQDILAIQNCDLFIYVGGENDKWTEDILKSFDEPVNTLKMIDCCDLLDETALEGMEHEHTENAGHDVHDTDEHVWTSLKNAEKISRAIAEKLSSADENNRDYYTQRLEDYVHRLDELDERFSQAVGSARTRVLVFGDRFPFRYFAEDYGLECYAAFPGCSAETEPSARTLAFLIKKVNEEKLPMVLYIEFSAKSVADSIAEQTGCKTALFHSCHNVTQEEIDGGATYLSLMEQNLAVLEEALN